MSRRTLTATEEIFPLAGRFVIARGAKTEARVVTVTLTADGYTGWGEAVPYARYGESVASVLAQIARVRPDIEAGADQNALRDLLPAGAARCAIDCALWDLAAARQGRSVAARLGLTLPQQCVTAVTLSLDTPAVMAARAAALPGHKLLKLKLGGGDDDVARVAAVHAAAPDAALILDANEGWTAAWLDRHLAALAQYPVVLVEQPLPAGQDAILAAYQPPFAFCADESCHTRAGLETLRERYQAINIKLDKTGGLTEALALAQAARALDFKIMVGCMVGTSLAMLPALHLAPFADWLDLDGPVFLQQDRPGGLQYRDGQLLLPQEPLLWGSGGAGRGVPSASIPWLSP
jgi:L-alanine-DL-glutamate epimerase-like enolase superfamily enzyme